MFSLSDYHYILPADLIAQEAIHPHHDARMMVIDRDSGKLQSEDTFWNIDEHLGDDRVIFFNDSRVVRSRVVLTDIIYTKWDGTSWVLTDGEIFYLSTTSDNEFEALVRPGNKFKIGTVFTIGIYRIEVMGMTESGRTLQIEWWDITSFLATYGALPLPPYIEYSTEKEADYQTSFARTDGSVAAPTASLHFTTELMERIKTPKEYLTLHVGLGTFKWIATPDIRDYDIHREKIEIELDIFARIADIKTGNKRVVAMGTTACRTLESLPYLWQSLDQDIHDWFDANTRKYWDCLTKLLKTQDWIHDITVESNSINRYEIPQKQEIRGREDFSNWAYEWISVPQGYFQCDKVAKGYIEKSLPDNEVRSFSGISFETSIYITPGYTFHVIDDLVTNFHLGESSLLVLVSAFLGYDATMSIYRYAVEHRYRFYSFGDGMYIRGK